MVLEHKRIYSTVIAILRIGSFFNDPIFFCNIPSQYQWECYQIILIGLDLIFFVKWKILQCSDNTFCFVSPCFFFNLRIAITNLVISFIAKIKYSKTCDGDHPHKETTLITRPATTKNDLQTYKVTCIWRPSLWRFGLK